MGATGEPLSNLLGVVARAHLRAPKIIGTVAVNKYIGSLGKIYREKTKKLGIDLATCARHPTIRLSGRGGKKILDNGDNLW